VPAADLSNRNPKGIIGMKQDQVEKGAIVQRDRETFAIAPHIPGGLTDPATLRKIAEVAERYGASALKLTSAQRIAIIGLAEEDIDRIWAELGEKPGAAIGMCVRSVKICPGTTYCKRGQQDSVQLGLEMDRRYHGMDLPWKFKMGISGCMNDCGEVCVKDLGLIGTPKGWNIMVGGNGGSRPRLSTKLFEHVASEQEALAIVDRVMSWFKAQNRRCRLGKFVEELGIEAFREEVLRGEGEEMKEGA
jgi:NAD(P)H-nitrite reductase large subunit